MDTSVITSADFTAVLSSLTGQISVSTVVEVLAVTGAAAVGLVFMWWGVRKVVSALMNAFYKGRLKLH